MVNMKIGFSLTLSALLQSCIYQSVTAFQIHSSSKIQNHHYVRFMPHTAATPSERTLSKLNLSTPPVEEDPLAGLSEERRQNLFNSLLRDLQIENTPLLGCDANAVHTMNAAIWTTMAELSENDGEQKVCFIMEAIPIGALQSFVQDFEVLKDQGRLMVELNELKRFHISLLGKGVGPALILETDARTPEEIDERKERMAIESALDEAKCTAALKSFIDRIVVGEAACPYTKSTNFAAIGLEAKGVTPGPVAYRFSPSTDACAAVGTFWNCVCELLSTPEEQLSTTMLSLPGVGVGSTPEAHARFVAVMELISRILCLFRGDDIFGLVHFHPAYTRSTIHPIDKPSYGHLPPQSWLRPILRHNGNTNEADNLSDDELVLSDYQRRSPFTAINILRTSQLNAANGAKSIVDLDINGDGSVLEKASGITTYSRNAIRLAGVREAALQEGVEKDMEMAFF